VINLLKSNENNIGHKYTGCVLSTTLNIEGDKT